MSLALEILKPSENAHFGNFLNKSQRKCVTCHGKAILPIYILSGPTFVK